MSTTQTKNTIDKAKEVLKIEADSINALIDRINPDFEKAVEMLAACKGKVIVTGIGKPGFIGQKISATMSSTGTPSMYLHPAEALHGDLGRIQKEDVVIAISNSGESEEVTRLLPLIKKMGIKLISLTGKLDSTLAKYSDLILNISVEKEACSLGLAPTSSTTAILAMGDALAICLLDVKDFQRDNYAFYHPGGALGRRLLLTVDDIMRKGDDNPIVYENDLVKNVLLKITEARAGAAIIINAQGNILGIFTDGDLRRHIEKGEQLINLSIKDVMTKNPSVIESGRLAAEAYKILKDKNIDEIPVVDKANKPIGMLDVQDLLKAGII